jgi:hypothetical protein
MKHVNATTNAIDEITSSPYFQTNFDSGSKDDATKEPSNRPITLNEIIKQKAKDQCP